MMFTFVPGFLKIYRETDAKLPVVTSIFIGIMNSLSNPVFWVILIAALFIGGFILSNYVETPIGRYNFDYIKLRIPAIGALAARSSLYYLYLNLACMLECGVTITESFRILKELMGNEVFRLYIDEVQRGLGEGMSLHELFSQNRFIPRYAVNLVESGEEAGELPGMMRKIATMMEEEISQSLETFLHLLEPLCIGVLAFVVGFILVATFLPFYGIMNSLS
jgi:type II secretory pathway component PulF